MHVHQPLRWLFPINIHSVGGGGVGGGGAGSSGKRHFRPASALRQSQTQSGSNPNIPSLKLEADLQPFQGTSTTTASPRSLGSWATTGCGPPAASAPTRSRRAPASPSAPAASARHLGAAEAPRGPTKVLRDLRLPWTDFGFGC